VGWRGEGIKKSHTQSPYRCRAIASTPQPSKTGLAAMPPRLWQCLNPQCGRTFQGEERGNPACPSCSCVRVSYAVPLRPNVSERGNSAAIAENDVPLTGSAGRSNAKPRDLNDIARADGIDSVRRCFDADAARPSDPPRGAKNAWAPTIKTAALLQGMTFPPLKYTVPGLIVEGLVLLAGPPKVKKSWLALDVGLAVAANGACLGDRKPEPGDVLYLALEDGERRLQQRMTKLLPTFGGKWPERFHYATKWSRADHGVEAIETWWEEHPGARLVVIDVFARFRAPTANSRNAYEQDYAALAKLQELATRRSITILVVHHTRKGASDDPVEEISGTLGLAGAADGFLVLKRTASGATLMGRCRDTDDVDLAMQFNGAVCRWTILGPAAEVHQSDERGRVLVALESADQGLSTAEIIAAATLTSRTAADKLLLRMASAGKIERIKRGLYGLPGTAEKLKKREIERLREKREIGRSGRKPLKNQDDDAQSPNLPHLPGGKESGEKRSRQ
jgi:hypothetical protein